MTPSARIALLGGLWLLPGNARAQGVVEGLVTNAADGQALADATVLVIGTSITTQTGAQGRYRLTGFAGPVELQAIRVGFNAAEVRLTVADSGVVVVNFQLRPAPVLLDQVVVTASGQASRQRQNGASVAQIVPDSFLPAAIQAFSDLITGRTSGVTVLHSGGSSGIGSRVRIRGSNSMVLSNEPLYVLDGIRIDNNPTTFSFETGDESPSRLDEIDPDYVQSVDVVKGPAASALYGTAAANGVIQLQTRQGTPGPARWTTYLEGGAITQPGVFPANYGIWTHSRAPPPGQNRVSSGLCTLVDVADGFCVPDSLAQYNPLVQASPFRTGYRAKLGLTVAGGVPTVTYFVGSNLEHEAGVNRSNDLSRVNLRGKLSGRLGNLEASLVSGFLHRDLGVPQNGFTYLGPLLNGLAGWPFPQSIDGYGNPTYGYNPIGPDQLSAVAYTQRIDHLTSAITANWRLKSWLALTGVTGLDHISQLNKGVVPPDRVFAPGYQSGLEEEDRSHFDILTINWSATAQFQLSNAARVTFTGGTQYYSTKAEGRFTTNATGVSKSTERGAHQKTIGGLLSAQIGWRDRAFLTAALRSDWSSGFGHGYGAVLYPAVMGSWVISDESFFPQGSFLTSLRLRAAYGRSGLLPGATDQLTLLQPVTVPVDGAEVQTVTADQLGNPNLQPERVAEMEAGFDAELAHGRIGLQGTYYSKRSSDALVLVPLAGSIGSASTQLQNVGVVSNEGLEVMMSADPIRSRAVVWSLSVALTANRNRLVSLGGGVSAIDVTPQQQLVPGYPLGGFWATPADSVVDLNGDGIIGSKEVFFDSKAPRQYVGTALPTRSLALMSSFGLTRGMRFWTQFDYEGGHRKYDFTERLRCQGGTCRP